MAGMSRLDHAPKNILMEKKLLPHHKRRFLGFISTLVTNASISNHENNEAGVEMFPNHQGLPIINQRPLAI